MSDRDNNQNSERTGLEIAIVGMAGKFPGANTLATFWKNLALGVDSIAQFTDEELLEHGIDASSLQKANYIKAKGFIEDVEYFDAAFFNYSAREAEMIDPQIRILQECAWEALENAGYVPQKYKGRIGLFAGASTNFQWMEHTPLGKGAQGAEFAEAATLSYKDALSTLTSYKLGLTGPSLTLYTACSTSLLGIHLACRALLTGECDLSLAGGVSISYPKKKGYLYEAGMTSSADGHVRPFDANAKGAVFSDGAGIVVLKRLEDALQDNDHIYAIIKGSAANNDGSRKVGYTAPSVEGQSEVIAAAQSVAEVEPNTISYIETHGTATALGDTIEFEALKRAFQTTKKSYCAIGSVKSNVGHLDTAAGVTGFMKTVLALQYQQIPPSLHFDHPNPKINFVDSPFYVNTELSTWDGPWPRRAGVSAFGYGGTNVHVILEEAPASTQSIATYKPQMLTLSARTQPSLEAMTDNLVRHLQANPAISLADVAYTLHVGREEFHYRRAVVCSTVEEAIVALSARVGESYHTNVAANQKEMQEHGDQTTYLEALNRFIQDPASITIDTWFLDGLARLWIQGKNIDWTKLYVDESRARLPLPTYAFEKQRFWIDPPSVQKPNDQIAKRANIADWFYTPIWREVIGESPAISQATWLVLLDNEHIGEQLVTRLQVLAHHVVTVRHANEFQKLNENEFTIRETQPEDYQRVLEEIYTTHPSLLRIVHCWAIEAQQISEARQLDLGFYSLLNLTKAIAQQEVGQQIELNVLTNQLYKVTNNEPIVPAKATLLAPIKVIPQEHTNVKCRCIDFDLADLAKNTLIDTLLQEIAREIIDTEVAYRDAHRYVQAYEALPVEKLQAPLALSTDEAAPALRREGVYVITGGLGGVGLKLAAHLARVLHARLALISREGLPPVEERQAWIETHGEEDRTSFRIRRVQELEAYGAKVLVIAADVADQEMMEGALENVEKTFDKIDGLIHAAGILRVHSALCPIITIGREECEEQFRPKMYGLNVLSKVLEHRQLDFCLLVSSLAPILGGLGFVAYAAANLYMDGFAAQHSADTSTRWITVNWGDWQYTGPKMQKRMMRTSLDVLEMTNEEAIKTFQCVLSLENTEKIIISSGDLFTRIEQWVQLKPLRQHAESRQTRVVSQAREPYRQSNHSANDQQQIEQIIVGIWLDFYRVQSVDHHKNFFELGATSLDIIQIHTKLVGILQHHVPIEVIFENPTIAQLALALSDEKKPASTAQPERGLTVSSRQAQHEGIAVIGMAGRFPGAASVDEFWDNLVNGVGSVRFFTTEELEAAGVPVEDLQNPNYRAAKGYLEGTEYFDAAFFDYTPRDALLMDPQLRVFHECAWSAVENAGYSINDYHGKMGVFAGASPNLYWQVQSLLGEDNEPAGQFLTSLLNDKDSLSTQISYKFNLNGPSFNIFSGCSTSLVAIDAACDALASGQCDMAIAGGITLAQPEKAGYIYQEGMLFSADGYCRAFDANASGMVFGDGVGVVILKTLEQAMRDGDIIHAVIKGAAINNDGHRKVGYTAPSVDGQFEVITAALSNARVEPESIGYIETHGTATQLGDVIEMAALKKAFGSSTLQNCPVGSVKTNVGHLNAASGAAGFIKTVLSLENKLIPPSLHFDTPNPHIDFAHSPFYVNTTLQEWNSTHHPLRAGVSSFGIGGTNAHVILEEAPVREQAASTERDWKMLVLSAKSPQVLERMTDNLAAHLSKHPEQSLANVAYTLHVGRQGFEYRRGLVCCTHQEAIDILSARSPQLQTFMATNTKRSLVFMFPGNGSQYVNMARELYETEEFFQGQLDTCLHILRAEMGIDSKKVLYPDQGDDRAQASIDMQKMEYSQPIIFCIEYALAQLLMHWGIQPSVMVGYSFGEYVAACLAGVFSLHDALLLVTARGRLMSALPEGAMLSVPLAEEQTTGLLHELRDIHENELASDVGELIVAIDNGPSCIVAGSPQAVSQLERFLRTKRVLSMRVSSNVAAHSPQMENIALQFKDLVKNVALHRPHLPFISGITGTWITEEQAQDPQYWVDHMKSTIRFARGAEELVKNDHSFFIEVGPGRDLSILLQRFVEDGTQRVQSTIRPEAHRGSDTQFLLEKLTSLWTHGIAIEWSTFYAHEQRLRIPLPTYAFERVSYKRNENPFELSQHMVARAKQAEDIYKLSDMSEWFYVSRWRSDVLPPQLPKTAPALTKKQQVWLVFMDKCGVALALVQALRNDHQTLITVEQGSSFAKIGEGAYQLSFAEKAHYQALVAELHTQDLLPAKILHCASLFRDQTQEDCIEAQLEMGFYSFLFMLQSLTRHYHANTLDIRIITNGTQNVIGDERLIPAHACIIGPGLVAAQELPAINCSAIDIVVPEAEGLLARKLHKQLLVECQSDATESIVAYRGEHRWIRDYQPIKLEKPSPDVIRVQQGGVYLITGGFGGIGRILARHLAQSYQAKIVLVSRTSLPQRHDWPRWLAEPVSDERKGIAEKMRFVQEIEALGAEVLPSCADAADLQGMTEVIRQAEQRFGAINGVIHGAGLIGDETFKLLNELEVADCNKQFQAKVHGVLVLNELLRDKPLDFCLLMSSIASVLGGLGYAAYTAANLFMDAFVHQQAQQSLIPWYAVNWSDWKYWDESETQNAIGQSVHKLSMTPEEGIDALERILACDERQVIHSPGNLDLRIAQWVKLQSVHVEESDPRLLQLHPRPDLSTIYIAPRNEVEKTLAKIWSTVFRVEQIGIADDFFDLSGDSLKGVTTVSRIHKELHVEVPISQLFLTPTIAALADYIQNAQRGELYSIPIAQVKPYYQLSSGQKRLYILQQLHPDSTAYNDVMAYTLEGALDIVRFEEIFKQLIERHESFRTSFPLHNGEPVQEIHTSVPFKLFYRETTEEDAKGIVRHFIAPFDVRTAPLMRVGLLKIGATRHILVLDIHHIITDGLSYDSLVHDFIALYRGDTLPALKLQYKDYAEWQYSEQAQALIAKQELYWLNKFADCVPALKLAIDYARPEIQNFVGDSMKFELGKELTEQVKQMVAAHDSTIYMYLLSVFYTLLFKYAGQNDIVVGSPVAGRPHPDLHGIIGMFVNMLPMRTFLTEDKTFVDYLHDVQHTALEAFENDSYQYEDLIGKLGLQGNVAENPLFNVVFVLQNTDTERLSVKDLQIEVYDFLPNRAQFDLLLSAVEIDGSFVMTLEYATALFRRETIEKMASRYIGILKQVLASPEITLGAITLSHNFQMSERDTSAIAREEFAF